MVNNGDCEFASSTAIQEMYRIIDFIIKLKSEVLSLFFFLFSHKQPNRFDLFVCCLLQFEKRKKEKDNKVKRERERKVCFLSPKNGKEE